MHYIPLPFLLIISLVACSSQAQHKEDKWSIRMARSVMERSDSLIRYNQPKEIKWQYDVALLGHAIDKLGSQDPAFSHYLQDYIDYFVSEDGRIQKYKMEDYNLDNINPAKNLITLYKRTGNEKYYKALLQFPEQLKKQPKTKAGGYWHKKIYPWQMWLDGSYMSAPFAAQYAKEFNQPEWFDSVTFQLQLIYDKTLDPHTGLLYHAWDESRAEQWCNPETGQSRIFWGRAMGWYMMALTDVLDFLPENHERRDTIIHLLDACCQSVYQVRDPSKKLWYQVLDQGPREGNYLEASASAMYIYVFAKAARKGYLGERWKKAATESFDSYINEFVTEDLSGLLVLHNTCGSCGLGGKPYRDGSYEYYIHEKRVDNDPKGVGPFILAALELNQ